MKMPWIIAILFGVSASPAVCEVPTWCYSHDLDANGGYFGLATKPSEPSGHKHNLLLGFSDSIPGGSGIMLISKLPLGFCRSSCGVRLMGLGRPINLAATETSIDESSTAYVLTGEDPDALFMAFQSSGEMDVTFPGDPSHQAYRFKYSGYDPQKAAP